MKATLKYQLLCAVVFMVVTLKATSPLISFTPVHCTKAAPVSLETTITDVDGIETSPGLKPRIYFKKKSEANVLAASNDNLSNGWKYVETPGLASPFSFEFDFSKLTAAPTKDDTIEYFVVAQDVNGEVSWNTVNFSTNPTSVALLSSAFPVTGVTNFYRTIKTYSGNITIDSTIASSDVNFQSITKSGGLFDALNNGALSGNLNVTIKHSLFAENGLHGLNQWIEYNGCNLVTNPAYRLKVMPESNGTQIRGKSTDAIIKLNGADRVTIDGRMANTSAVNGLTIANDESADNTATIYLIASSSNSCERDTIRFCNIIGGSPQNSTAHNTFGVIAGSSAIADFSGSKGKAHKYNSFERNAVTRVRYGIALLGADTALGKCNAVQFNIVGPDAEGIDAIGKIGIALSNQDSAYVIGNKVKYVGGDLLNIADTADRAGIFIGTIRDNLWNNTFKGDSSTTVFKNALIDANIIYHIVNEAGYSAVGLAYLNSHDLSATGNIVSNNMIYNIRANGYTAEGDHAAAIGIIGGHTDIFAHNSVNMVDDMDPAGVDNMLVPAAGIRVNSTAVSNPITSNLTLKNNSIAVDITVNSSLVSHAISLATDDDIWGAGALDFNNYFNGVANTKVAVGGIGSGITITDQATLTNWQGVFAYAQDNASISTDPEYNSSTNLHIKDISPNIEAGDDAMDFLSEDFDGDYRFVNKYPAIGADEFGKNYVWYGRESSSTAGVPNWRNYEVPDLNGNDSLRVLVDTRNASWILDDSFVVADITIKDGKHIGLDGYNFHVKNSAKLLGNATIYSDQNTCTNVFGVDDTYGALYLSSSVANTLEMDSGSICNLVVTTDMLYINSNLNIANDFISKRSTTRIEPQLFNINVQGDIKLYGELAFQSTSNSNEALININGTVEQNIEIRNVGAQPGIIGSLKIDKDAAGNNSVARLVANLNISNYLLLNKGKLISDGSNYETGFRYKTISMLNADSSAVVRSNGNTNDAFFQGKLKRVLSDYAARYLFPIGIVDVNGKHGAANTAFYTPVAVEVQDGSGADNFITATFYDDDPDSANIGFTGELPGDYSSAIEDGASSGNWVDVKGDYVWHVEYDGTNLPYHIQFAAPFMTANNQDELAGTPQELRILKRSTWNSGSWAFQGTHAVASTHTLLPDFSQTNAARRTGLNTFSGFSAGGNSAAGQPLPVKLIELTARAVNNEFIQVEWSTASEINNAGFEVQRSTNGREFTTVGFVAGSGNSTETKFYRFDDKNVKAGERYYYRLQQIDFDGAGELTNIVSAALADKSIIKWMQLVPNPAEQASSIVVSTNGDESVNIIITTIKGDVVLDKKEVLYGGINNIDLNLNGYTSGTYLVTVRSATETFSRRLVVQ